MPAATPVDQNVIFLYKCLQHAGKINFKALSGAEGIKEETLRMRHFRLSKKIEEALRDPSSTSGTSSMPTPKSPQPSRGAASKKRRIGDTDGARDSSTSASAELDETPSPRSRTRGKKICLKFQGYDDDDSDWCVGEDSEDGDFHPDPAKVKEESDDEYESGIKEGYTKPNRPHRSSFRDVSVPAQASSKHMARNRTVQPVTVASFSRPHKKKKPTPQLLHRVVRPKAPAGSHMRACDIPIPSIEHSPTPFERAPSPLLGRSPSRNRVSEVTPFEDARAFNDNSPIDEDSTFAVEHALPAVLELPTPKYERRSIPLEHPLSVTCSARLPHQSEYKVSSYMENTAVQPRKIVPSKSNRTVSTKSRATFNGQSQSEEPINERVRPLEAQEKLVDRRTETTPFSTDCDKEEKLAGETAEDDVAGGCVESFAGERRAGQDFELAAQHKSVADVQDPQSKSALSLLKSLIWGRG